MRQLFAILAASALFAACQTADSIQPTDTLNFEVTANQELGLDNTGGNTINVEVAQVSGKAQTFTLTVSGLPAKVTGNFTSTTGMGSFSSDLVLDADFAQPGQYTVTVTAKAEDGTSKSVNVPVVVSTTDKCNAFIGAHMDGATGTYIAGTDSMVDAGPTFVYNGGTGKLYMNDVVMGNLKSGSGAAADKNNVAFEADCASNQITVPQQAVLGRFKSNTTGLIHTDTAIVNGTGSFDYAAKTFVINYQSSTNNGGTIVNYTVKGKLK